MLAGNVGTNEIIRLDMETLSYIKIPVANVTSPKDIVFDPVDDRIYWTADKTIETALLNGTYKSVLPNLDNEDAEYDGIALDILARRIFYTDAGNDVIGDIRIPEYEYRTFITSGLDQPRDIVLHTGIRVMFWTDVGKEPKIERANYDGTKRVAIIQNLKQPNALSIDLKNERLYWTDAETDLVTSSGLDGRDQRLIHTFEQKVHVFGMALHGNQIYFTDWSGNKSDSSVSFLRRMNFNGTDETKLMSFKGHLYDIHIYTSTSLPEPVATRSRPKSSPALHVVQATSRNEGDGCFQVQNVAFQQDDSSPYDEISEPASFRNEGDGCFQVQNVAFQQDDSGPYDIVLSEAVRAPFHPRNAHPALTPSSKQSGLGKPADDYLTPTAGPYSTPGAHDNATGNAHPALTPSSKQSGLGKPADDYLTPTAGPYSTPGAHDNATGNTSNDFMQLTGDKCGPTSD
ncbi:hypothetical protein BaRGS_00020603 [Batillaria attramentaria]|uniref:Uncharacterized protein n=1 Tax=Batillaria attramentaria TaxID=370345 RepID=A0ABD0KM43_9CAEN